MAFDLSIFRRSGGKKLPSLSEQFRERVASERGSGTMKANSHTGLRMCIWTECDHAARREHLVAIREGAKPLFYFFCSDRHKKMWLHSVVSMGNLPTGDRGTIT